MLDNSPETKDTPRRELEAEVGALKDQLSMAQSVVNQTFTQMALQKARTKQLIAAWKVRLEEGEERLRKQRAELEAQMQLIVSDLFLFEGALKREQKEIQDLLRERDHTILTQKQTIESLTATNASLVASLKKMKKKYKRKQTSKNSEGTSLITSESRPTRTIQDEADEIIRQMFGVGEVDPSSCNHGDEESLRLKEVTTGSEQESDRNQAFTDVCFYLTETKNEHAQAAMKLHRNEASRTHVCGNRRETMSLLDAESSHGGVDAVTLTSIRLPEGQQEPPFETDGLQPQCISNNKSPFTGSNSGLDSILEEKLETREEAREWAINATNLLGLLQDGQNANIDTVKQKCESEPGYETLFYSKNVISSKGPNAVCEIQSSIRPSEEEIYENLPVSTGSNSKVCVYTTMSRDTGHRLSRKSYDVT